MRYTEDGVKNSEDIEVKIGTRFGGFGELALAASTSRTVSSDGCTPNFESCGQFSPFRL